MKSKIISTKDLSETQILQMFALFENYYKDISLNSFRKDLAEKTHVFLFTNHSKIIGFSTIFRKKLPAIGPGTFLFSGDTVLKKEYWGASLLQMTFFKYIVASKFKSPFRPVYWMLISKGYKTYLMMMRNFPVSFPSYSKATPQDIQQIQDRFYTAKFGNSYSAETGIIRFPVSHGAVKDGMACPTHDAMQDPHIRYFVERNPAYQDGEELACITKIQFSDFFHHILKYFVAPKKKRSSLQQGLSPISSPLVKRG